jgi:hypothetical protein
LISRLNCANQTFEIFERQWNPHPIKSHRILILVLLRSLWICHRNNASGIVEWSLNDIFT